MFNVGSTEFVVIMLFVLLLFGAKRIPEMSRALGKGLADFRNAVSGVERELKGELLGPAPEARPRPPATPPAPPPAELTPGGREGPETTSTPRASRTLPDSSVAHVPEIGTGAPEATSPTPSGMIVPASGTQREPLPLPEGDIGSGPRLAG